MRARVVSILLVLLMAFTLIPAAVVSNTQSAEAVDLISCSDTRISASQVRIICTAAGVVVLNTVVNLPPGPTVEVTLPQQTVTVHVPGPSSVQTIRVPVPGPTQSVTVTEPVVGPTKTVHETEHSTETSTITATATITKSTGQVDNGGGTIDHEPSTHGGPIPQIDTPAKAAVLGLGLLIILLAIVLLGLYLGYILGYKDSDRANANFMNALLGKFKGE